MPTPEEIIREAKELQEADLEKAKAALQSANACGDFGFTYRIARVELDEDPPFAMIVNVKASELDGVRLPAVPVTYAQTQETYLDVAPGQEPAFRNAPMLLDPVDVELDKLPGVRTDVAIEEFGEHRLYVGGSHCLDCGRDVATLTISSRCGR